MLAKAKATERAGGLLLLYYLASDGLKHPENAVQLENDVSRLNSAPSHAPLSSSCR